jgi:hypothetical protein
MILKMASSHEKGHFWVKKSKVRGWYGRKRAFSSAVKWGIQ